jgi:hypothetical protein
MRERDRLSHSKSLELAKQIIAIPTGEVPNTIHRMVRNRNLSRAVSALNDLSRQPEHIKIAKSALAKFGLWPPG